MKRALHLSEQILRPVRTLRQRIRPRLHQLAQRWQGLSARERQQVSLMAVLLVCTLLWLLFTRPALHTLQHWEQELPRLRSQQAALQTVLADVGAGGLPQGNDMPLMQRVTDSLIASGLTHGYAITSQGSVWIIAFKQPVATARLVSWLLNSPPVLGMTVLQVRLERVNASKAAAEQDAGVTASVTLEVQQRKGE